jgi:hypothetical protein
MSRRRARWYPYETRVKEVVGFKEVFQGVREDSLKKFPCNIQEEN